jgi:hypothetical protein
VDKSSSPQAEKSTPEFLKPPSPKGARGTPGVGGTLPSLTRSASGHNPVGTPSGSGPTESPETTSLSPWSYGLGAAGGYVPGDGSSVTHSEKQSEGSEKAIRGRVNESQSKFLKETRPISQN